MKVRTCQNCPYMPADLGPHFSPHAQELCCIDCQVARPVSSRVYPRRRPKAPAFAQKQELAGKVEAPHVEPAVAP